MNLILEHSDQVKYYTNMPLMLDALGMAASAFDWFVSDIETNCNEAEFSSDDQWIAGEDLQQLLSQTEVQFIWGVFSAVPKGSRPNVTDIPYVDGNPDYWRGKEIEPQLRGALFEIASWDSSATIFVGLPSEAAVRFCKTYSDAKLLATGTRKIG